MLLWILSSIPGLSPLVTNRHPQSWQPETSSDMPNKCQCPSVVNDTNPWNPNIWKPLQQATKAGKGKELSRWDFFFLGNQLKCLSYALWILPCIILQKGPEASTSWQDYKKYWPTYQGRNIKVQREKFQGYMGFSLSWLSRCVFATYF